ncbi:MAG: hypothetical protein ACD_17C00495G0002 [uncultured bacterium]|nr:MAG: hypothetical protein ACD_17C00495G0002 [uncultured bacterium]OGN55816.1 MAG: ribosome biogenesis GTPase Der [Chlamydiae bacterium RIFCSPHIGHO2_01_FULL_44_39]OGN58319.1 MAG: ribosome biogenesis GTPase Der [Chlamydiae bacterium RIFCSPHIGHO2_02_FULL_45_9]OGN60348.1 MAG: ribosome biogenesis GTPase Der [Chlamydiae bacterium RIFCSPHIGHO2_12_FULL_44_59]OGN66331.1 MAG: ribosome biogenesis GTPase Der [Chlamydiae bacterium RIFCSPLOWO2_01_FULL_44_52]OGN69282.1 MAG: ribosome biogenesis GTPase Der 
MALSKIAIVGRPNVGKSALFNRICQKRSSIVHEQEGITRDRLYERAEVFGRECIFIDTGGIDSSFSAPFHEEIRRQAKIAIEEADVVVLVVDGSVGLHPLDKEIAQLLLQARKRIVLVVNKIDQRDKELRVHEFHSLAIPDIFGVSATQGFQVAEALEKVVSFLPDAEEEREAPSGIRVAIVGRANVGKSTLLNHLLGAERSIVSPIPGTTRDSIDALVEWEGVPFIFIDTAGIRRKKSEKEAVDKFAFIRTQEAIRQADLCLLVLDSTDGFTTQEKRIASELEAQGKSCILIFNKWDLVKNFRMEHAAREVREQVSFLNHCPTLFIAALEGRNVQEIFPLIQKVYQERNARISTGELNKFVMNCLQKYHPPLITGKRLRIYYMTQVETNPPKFVLFINRPNLMTESYKKYLINHFRKAYGFLGTPLTLECRSKEPISQALL